MRRARKRSRSKVGKANMNKSSSDPNPGPDPDSMDVDPEYGGSVSNECVPYPNKRLKSDTTSNAEPKHTFIFHMLPNEIIMEIFKYLRPTDLLSLNRCKPFRSYLMTKTPYQSTWWAVMGNVKDLPDCPLDVSVPRYMTVLFSDFCMSCGSTDKSQLDVTLLVRLCKPCETKWLAPLVSNQVPVEIREFLPKSNVFGKAKNGELPDACVLKSEIDRVIKVLDEAERFGDENALAKLKRDMEEAALERKNQSDSITRALTHYQNEIDCEKIDIRKQRRLDIEQRCVDILKFEGEDLAFAWSSSGRKKYDELLDKPQLLSEPEWEEICPALVRLLRLNREARLARNTDNQKQSNFQWQLGCPGQAFLMEADPIPDGLYQGDGIELLG